MQSQESIAATTTPGNVGTKFLRKDKSQYPAVRQAPFGLQAAGYPTNGNFECFLCCNIFFIRVSNILGSNIFGFF
jgi:hypothetical protein